MKSFFGTKNVVAMVCMVVIIHLLLAYASFGPTATSEVKDLPIGFFNADEGRSDENLGLVFEQIITRADNEAVKWYRYESVAAMREALAEKTIYGGLVLPPDLTESVQSLHSETPRQTIAKVYLNEGMNVVGATTVHSMISGIIDMMNQEIRIDMYGTLQGSGQSLQLIHVESLTEPVVQQVERFSPIGSPARGQLPLILTVLLWLGSLIGSLLIWLMLHNKDQVATRFVGTQLLAGILLAAVQAISTLVVVGWLMGMELVNFGHLIGFLMATSYVFFLIQSSALNWLGFKGWPVLILIWLFGLPVVSLPPEFLSAFYRGAIYSWIPFRFSVEGLSSILFFDTGGNLSAMVTLLGWIGTVFIALLLMSHYTLNRKDLSANPMARRLEPH